MSYYGAAPVASYAPTYAAAPPRYSAAPTYTAAPISYASAPPVYPVQQQYYAAPVPVQQEVKMTRPKMEYTSDYVMVPKTIQVPQIIKEKAIRMVPKETYETKIVAIQVPRTITVSETVQKDVEITVPQLQYVDREIRIPEQVMETKTVRVPRQRIVIEEEEHTHEAPAYEEYTTTVAVANPTPVATYAPQTYAPAATYSSVPTTQYAGGYPVYRS